MKIPFRKLTLDELPGYSAWPQRLLGSGSAPMYPKSSAAIYREYEMDKWAVLFSQLEKQHHGLDDIDLMQFASSQDIAFSLGEDIYLGPPLAARALVATLIADSISEVRNAGDPVVELGAGTGAIIARIAKDPRFSDATFHAGDFSPSSVKIMDYLARVESFPLKTGLFNFQQESAGLEIPEGSVIITSFAVAYFQGLDGSFWRRLAQLHPRAIVIAEPIYQHFGEGSLLGLLRKRYYEANDYSRDILPSIQAACETGALTIASVKERVLGVNPLCPVSIVTLLPARPRDQ